LNKIKQFENDYKKLVQTTIKVKKFHEQNKKELADIKAQIQALKAQNARL